MNPIAVIPRNLHWMSCNWSITFHPSGQSFHKSSAWIGGKTVWQRVNTFTFEMKLFMLKRKSEITLETNDNCTIYRTLNTFRQWNLSVFISEEIWWWFARRFSLYIIFSFVYFIRLYHWNVWARRVQTTRTHVFIHLSSNHIVNRLGKC